MIAYTEKGYGLHAAIAAAGHWLEKRDGVWVASDEAAVQAIIDGYDPLPLARDAAWEQIKAERDRRKAAGVMVRQWRFHSDADSRIQQLGLKDQARDLLASGAAPSTIMRKRGEPIYWKTLDGSFAPMTIQLALDVVDAIGDADSALFKAAEMHKAAAWASSDPQQYDYSSGWPEV
jgi:hypothetical protein